MFASWSVLGELQLTQISMNFQISFCSTNQRCESKTVWLFYYFYFTRNYDVLKSRSLCFLLNKNISFKKTRRNREWKIPHSVLER